MAIAPSSQYFFMSPPFLCFTRPPNCGRPVMVLDWFIAFLGISSRLTLKRFLNDPHFSGALYLNNLGLVHSNLHHTKLQRADLPTNYLPAMKWLHHRPSFSVVVDSGFIFLRPLAVTR